MKKSLMKVLYLGVTGRIGPGLLEEYQKKYSKYYDVIIGTHSSKKIKGFKTVKFDLNNLSLLKKAMKGIDVVLNLAAESDPNASFNDIIRPNIIGTYNVLEAARQAKVKRVIIASSVHAIRGYSLKETVKPSDAPKPPNFYGASKVFGEALCYVFSNKYNLSCLAIRIGAYTSNDNQHAVCLTRDNYDYVISQRDFGQLIHKSIVAPKKVKYGILSGASNNKHKYLNLDSTKKLVGYKPQDNAHDLCIKHKREKKK